MKQRKRVKLKYTQVWPVGFWASGIVDKMRAAGTPGPYYVMMPAGPVRLKASEWT
jgi:hypothetical protein